MSHEHKDLAAGRWRKLTFIEQMANIGSEVERALNWQDKKNPAYSQKAFERAIELLDLAIECISGFARLKELTRVREALTDFFAGQNQFRSTRESWKKYFLPFAYAARRNR